MKHAVRLGGVAACLFIIAGGVSAGAVLENIELGSSPSSVTAGSHPRVLYVATDDGISVVEPRSLQVTRELPLSMASEGVAIDPARDRLWVLQPHPRNAERPGQVTVLRADDGAVLKTVATLRGPVDVGFIASRDLGYVLDFYDSAIEVFDGPSMRRVATVGGRKWREGKIGYPQAMVMDNRRGLALVVSSNGYLLKVRGSRVVAKTRVSRGDDHQLAVDARRGRVYVARLEARSVLEFRTRTLKKLRRFRPRHGPWDLSVDARLHLLGIVTHSSESTYFEAMDLDTERWTARVETGFAANDVATIPGRWRFFITDSFAESLLVAPGEDAPPTSVLDVADGSTLSADESFTGSSFDGRSGIKAAAVVFENETGRLEIPVVLACSTAHSCTWRGEVPDTAGIYEVTTLAQDRAGNLEQDVEPTTVTVVP